MVPARVHLMVKSMESGEDVGMNSGFAESDHRVTMMERATPATGIADAEMSAPSIPAPKTPVRATNPTENDTATPSKSTGKKRVRRTRAQSEADNRAKAAKAAEDANTDDVSDTEKQPKATIVALEEEPMAMPCCPKNSQQSFGSEPTMKS